MNTQTPNIWTVRTTQSRGNGPMSTRDYGFPTKRAAVRFAQGVRDPDKNHIARIGHTYVVPVKG